MDPEAFRREAHRVADWIADSWPAPGGIPSVAGAPGEIRECPAALGSRRGGKPSTPSSHFERILLPGITHWITPASSPTSQSPAAGRHSCRVPVGALNRPGHAVARTSPAATGLKTSRSRGCGADGAAAEFRRRHLRHGIDLARSRLAAARERRVPGRAGARAGGREASAPARSTYCLPTIRTRRLTSPSPLGLGHARCGRSRATPSSAASDALASAIAEDRALQDVLPLAVVATVGTTSSTSVDPCRRLRRSAGARDGGCRRCGLCRRGRDGAGMSDSARREHAVFARRNPHKWLFTSGSRVFPWRIAATWTSCGAFALTRNL